MKSMHLRTGPMRLFYAAGDKPNSALHASRIWYYNLYLSLRDLGFDLVSLEYDLDPHYNNADFTDPIKNEVNANYRPLLESALLDQIRQAHRKEHIDIFFSYFYSSFVRPEIITAIRDMGIITINWYCNASYQFHLIESLAPAYDFCLVPEKYRIDDYRKVGANPIYCQEAANPNFYKPYPLPQIHDVSFVGARYGDRPKFIRYLIDKGINVKVWGPGWSNLCAPQNPWKWPQFYARRAKSRMKGYCLSPLLSRDIVGGLLSDEEMVQMYSLSKISLGFSKVGETHLNASPIKQVRLRDFEAAMSGAFYMAEYMEELEEFFDIGKEIICYFDEADLADKVKYFLKHESEREKIRQAGYQRAIQDHSWQKRFQDVFKQIGVL